VLLPARGRPDQLSGRAVARPDDDRCSLLNLLGIRRGQRQSAFRELDVAGRCAERAVGENVTDFLAIDDTGAVVGTYDKFHLVPFGEYVPEWIPFLHTLVPEIADFKPAKDMGVIQARGISYGSLICYESLFPEEARGRVLNGAEVLVNVTNDAWYGTTPAAWQHFQAARMRAVETGRYVLRAANTGVTAIIQPDGVVRSIKPWWIQTVLLGTYQLSKIQTNYVRWGDWPLFGCLIMLAVPCFFRRERI